MGWLPVFLNKKKSQDQQSSNHAESHHAESQPSTTVVQILVEETIMAVAQWLITFINRSIVNRPTQPQPSHKQPDKQPEQPNPEASTSITPIEELLSKFGILVEQLSQREAAIVPLQHRLNELENAVKQSGKFEQQMQTSDQLVGALADRLMQVEQQMQRLDTHAIEASLQKSQDLEEQAEIFSPKIAALDDRLTRLENIAKQVDLLVEELHQANENTRTLEARIGHLEKLLARFNVIPKVVEGNYRAIVALQSQVENSKALSNGNHKNSQHDGTSIISMR